MIKFGKEKECVNQIMEAMKSNDEDAMQKAWASLHDSIAEQVKADFADLQESHDSAILAQRGYRQLTSTEKKWYERVIEALKSSNPKQAFIEIIGSDAEDAMPTTIIEDVYKHLQEEHPLLRAINFQYVGYLTNWILNDHATQMAVWGQITDEIIKEITSAFKVVPVNQNKLSAYAVVEKGMLDLGPVFLDGYVRACLAEAIFAGLEEGIVKGTGKNQPIGLIRDIHKGVSVNEETGYPAKSKETVKSFAPAEYGALVAKMAVTESGRKRKFTEVGLICNQNDYLTKVMPATTVLNANGVYVNDLFPIPTEVFVCNALEDGEAVLFLKNEYFMGMGGEKNGVIEYSDEAKFIEDQRVFKIKQYGGGRAFDNTSALFLNISALEPAYITVKDATPTA